jgi:hypothetical protein
MKKILTGLIALLFIGISASIAQSEKETKPPPPPAPPALPTISIADKQANEFYKLNPTVTEISRQGNWITLKMKDGSSEKYDMSNKDDKKNFADKYGESPLPDPPPPPKKVDEIKMVPPPPPPAPPKPKKIN